LQQICLPGDPEVFWERMPLAPQSGRALEVRETAEGHLLDRVLGWGAIAPLAACAVAAWLSAGSVRAVVMSLAIIWGGAVLVFLAGVRRGLGFHAPGGMRSSQIVFMLWTFALAFGSMIALQPLTSLGLLMLGYAGMALSARAATLREEVPIFSAGLRPVQMSIALLSLCAVAARLIWRL
jgi:hypothetical protein